MSEIDTDAIMARTSVSDLTNVPMFTSLESTGVPPNDHPETEAEAFKRMIQERNRDEAELEAAVPTSGVSSVINSRANSRVNSRAPSINNTSGATTPRRDLFSGVSSMKEMFDISYAVHRITEEKQRRKTIKPDSNNRRSLFMSAVNGDDDEITEDEADLITDETSSTQTTTDDNELEALKNKMDEVQIRTKQSNKSNKNGGLFELNMNNATLLGRRKIPSATQPIDEQ
jgi:hypothetical protein